MLTSPLPIIVEELPKRPWVDGEIIEFVGQLVFTLKQPVPVLIAPTKSDGVPTDVTLAAFSPQANPLAKLDATDGTLHAEAAQLLYDEYPG